MIARVGFARGREFGRDGESVRETREGETRLRKFPLGGSVFSAFFRLIFSGFLLLLGMAWVRGEEGKGNGSGRVGWVLGRVGWVMVNWVGLENKRIGCWD